MTAVSEQPTEAGSVREPAIIVRKRAATIETVWHDGGPPVRTPVRYASALAVIANPFAGRYEPDLLGLQDTLRGLGHELATELVGLLGRDQVQVYRTRPALL